MNAWSETMLWCAVQVTLFATAASLVYLATRRLGPAIAARCVLGTLVVVALLTLIAPSPWPSWLGARSATAHLAGSDSGATAGSPSSAEQTSSPVDTASSADESGATTDLSSSAGPGGATAGLPSSAKDTAADSQLTQLWSAFRDALSQSAADQSSADQSTASQLRNSATTAAAETAAWNWRTVFMGLMLSALALGILRTLGGLMAVRRYRRRSRPIDDAALAEQLDVLRARLSHTRPIELRETDWLPSAATLGWRRPVILLPTCWRCWTAAQRRVVLAHELAHVGRSDFLGWLAAQLGLVLHFYHPLVHWLARRLRLEQELAADADAARLVGNRRTYLTTLAELALAEPSIRLGWPAHTFLPTRGMLLRRIEMLRNRKRQPDSSPSRSSRAARWATLVVLLAAALSVAGLRSAAEDTTDEPAATAQATAPHDNSAFRHTFSNGTEVELVGVGYHPSAGRQWWAGDGTPLSEAPYAKFLGQVMDPGKLVREFCVRVQDMPDGESLVWSVVGSGSAASGEPRTADGKPIPELAVNARALPTDAKTCAIRAGVPTGEWASRDIEFDGRNSTATGNQFGTAACSPATENDGKVNIVVSHNLRDDMTRLVAFDAEGNAHLPAGVSSVGGTGFRQMAFAFENIALDDIEKFQLQGRSREWFEFKNIQLNPTDEADAHSTTSENQPPTPVTASNENVAEPVRVTLPDVDRRDTKTILDLASGQFIENLAPKNSDGSQFTKLGKGDLWFDQAIGTLRGGTIQAWDETTATDIKSAPGTPDRSDGIRVYQIAIPSRLLVTTGDGKRFDVLALKTTDDGSLVIEYKPIPKPPYPTIVFTTPKIGATDVDPKLNELSVTFDRDMQSGMSWTGGPPLFPPVDKSKQAHWQDKRTCILPVKKLAWGQYYRVGINSTSHQNFRSAGGTPVLPAVLYFVTAGANADVKRRVRAPRILQFEPKNGATDVDPDTKVLSVAFSVPMDTGGMSWTGEGPHFPPIDQARKAQWSADKRTCTLPVNLKPGWHYRCGLNSLHHINFQSEWGVPLQPVVYEFTTAAAQPESAAPVPSAGIRAQEKTAPAEPQNSEKPDHTPNTGTTKFNLSYVPDDAAFYVAVRTAEIYQDERFQPLLKQLDDLNRIGVSVQQIEQITLAVVPRLTALPPGAPDNSPPRLYRERQIFRLKEKIDLGTALHKWYRKVQATKYNGQVYYALVEQPDAPAYWMPDDHTIISQSRPELLRLIDAVENGTFRGMPNREVDHAVQLLFVANDLKPFRDEADRGLSGGFPLQMISPLLRSADEVVVTMDVLHQVACYGAVKCNNAEDAKQVADTLTALRTILKNTLDEQLRATSGLQGTAATAIRPLLELINLLITGTTVEVEGPLVRIQSTPDMGPEDVAQLIQQLLPAVTSARDAARQTQSVNNLKRIGVALHNYQGANGRFPPAVLVGPDGKTPYSWRVAILPYMEQATPYDQYKFDEPWDSPHNRKLLTQMPAAFRNPKDDPNSTNTSYFVLTGPETMFAGKEGTETREVTDGMSNTLMVVEAKRAVPWTKPEDIPYAADKPVPKLGGWFDKGFNVAFADGSVRFLPEDINEQTLRAYITKAGGERIDLRHESTKGGDVPAK